MFHSVREHKLGVLVLAMAVVVGAHGAAAAQAPSLKELLEKTGLAFAQPDPQRPVFRVTIESGGSVSVVVCQESTASWKYADGSEVKYVNFWVQVTPLYGRDVAAPTPLLRKMAEENDRNIFVKFGMYVDASSGEWAMFGSSNLFLRGADEHVLEDYLYLMQNGHQHGRKTFLPFMEE
jgi:hypothetical protein